jgi:hypothetical protein
MNEESSTSKDSRKNSFTNTDNDQRRSLSYQEIVQLTNKINNDTTDTDDTADTTSSGGVLDGSVSMSDI